MLHSLRMKEREIFSPLKVPGTVIVRIDGRGFGKALQQLNFDKPYDIRFARALADSTEVFFEKSGMVPTLAYLFSDEVNLLFMQDLPFNGRVEKLDSIIPSFFASALVIHLNITQPLSFDSRIVMLDAADILDYLNWRQEECWRNLVHSYGYHLLQEGGISARLAAETLKGMRSENIHELAWSRGINLADTPPWQRRGILVYKKGSDEALEKGKKREIVQDWEPPIFKTDVGRQLIQTIIKSDI